MSVQIAKHWFTVAEYERMGAAGILPADDRVELIAGDIIEMSPIGKRHAACVGRLTQALGLSLQRKAIIWVQNPIQIDDHSEPQPDIAILKPRADFYEQSLPTPADVLLVIEVSDTTLEYDRQIKLPLYAHAGIPEVWLVNLPAEQLDTYAQPAGDTYQLTNHIGRGAGVQAHRIADLRISVADVLG